MGKLTTDLKDAVDLKDVIESLVCPEHNTHPVMMIGDQKTTLECCCPKCQAQCHYLINKMSTSKSLRPTRPRR